VPQSVDGGVATFLCHLRNIRQGEVSEGEKSVTVWVRICSDILVKSLDFWVTAPQPLWGQVARLAGKSWENGELVVGRRPRSGNQRRCTVAISRKHYALTVGRRRRRKGEKKGREDGRRDRGHQVDN